MSATNASPNASRDHFDYVVIGGGIAGVTCIETLCHLHEEASVALVSASPTVKAAVNLRRVTRMLEDFDVAERDGCELERDFPNLRVISDVLERVEAAEHSVTLASGRRLSYGKLCLCMGGSPKLLSERAHPLVLGIRDTESAADFQRRLGEARRILLVGNGGIATELAFAVRSCAVVWVIKDRSISATFVDAGAAEFLMPRLLQPESAPVIAPCSRRKFRLDADVCVRHVRGPGDAKAPLGGALGPDWAQGLNLEAAASERAISVVPEAQVATFWDAAAVPEEKRALAGGGGWPLFVELTNGQVFGCDFLVSATGVTPNASGLGGDWGLALATDGGIAVDERMATSRGDIFAAGDCASAAWEWSPHWFQMRLWCQARQMAFQAAKAMVAEAKGEEPVMGDFAFELFTHTTQFFGMKIVLLGKFNAQGLPPEECELLLRMTKGVEYIKCVMRNGRMQGCLLIGETDLEETFENLILNQLDLSQFGTDLLDPNIDIEDFFD